ncbi:MAG: hypothetical protein ABR552_02755 [Actinomycetota bacterium]
MWSRLEHELRLLPQVVAVTVTPRDVVVLVDPGADVRAMEAAVASVLDSMDVNRSIRVVGGAEPLTQRLTPSGRRWAFMAGAAAASFVVAVAQLTGSSTPVEPSARAAAPATSHESVRSSGGVPGSHPIELVASHDVVATASHRHIVIRPLTVPPPAVVVEPGAPAIAAAETCNGPDDREAPRARHGEHRGEGPRPWSRSALVAPHDLCEHGHD